MNLNYRITAITQHHSFIVDDGKYSQLPSPLQDPVRIQFLPNDKDQDVSLSIYTDYKHLKVEAFVYDMMSVSWLKYSNQPVYKNSASGQGLIEMYIESENFKKATVPSILLEVTRSADAVTGDTPFDADAVMGVMAQNSIVELKSGVKVRKLGIKGQMNYYHVHVPNREEILLTLNVQTSGDSDIFVNPGKFNFPSTQEFYRRSNSAADDELTLTKEDHDKNYPNPATDVWYTVGIYTFTACEFELLSLFNKFKVIHTETNKLYSFVTKSDNPVIFEMVPGVDQFQIDVLFWSDTSLLNLYVTRYNKDDDFNQELGKIDNPLLRNIPKHDKKYFEVKSQIIGTSVRASIPLDFLCQKCYYLVGVYPQ